MSIYRKIESAGKTHILNVLYWLFLAAVLVPFMLVARYDRPAADDWSYGAAAYRALTGGGGFSEFILALVETVRHTYDTWEGRFTCVFLEGMMPGIWGEHVYAITPYIIILSIVISEYVLLRAFTGLENRKYVAPVLVPCLVMQIFYQLSISEAFFWYNGSIIYTFLQSVSFVFLAGVFYMRRSGISKARMSGLIVLLTVTAFFLGGATFVTSVYVFLTLIILLVLYSVRDGRVYLKLLPPVIALAGGLAVCLLAPGNSVRLSNNFSGMQNSPIRAVIMSIWRTCTNIFSWTVGIKWTIPVLLMILPFIIIIVKKMDHGFTFPGAFTFFSTGIYASQMVATMYVDGTSGGGRQAAVLYESYWLWLILNLLYWTGWICRLGSRIKKEQAEEIPEKKRGPAVTAHPYLISGVLAFMILAGMFLTGDYKNVSSYKAYRDYRQGIAAGYAAEWDARYEVLHDTSVTDPVFEPLNYLPETICYTDLQDENGYVWVNDACAGFYGKNSVTVVSPER